MTPQFESTTEPLYPLERNPQNNKCTLTFIWNPRVVAAWQKKVRQDFCTYALRIWWFMTQNYVFQNLDLTTYRLIYDGPLTLKLGDTKRFKTIDLHVVLLEDCIMLLQKQDDKYLLKFHTSTVGNAAVGSQGHKFCHSPVIKFSAMLVRPVATGKPTSHSAQCVHMQR